MTATTAIGAGLNRIEAAAKVTGVARYAGEIPLDGHAYGSVVQSTIARGQVTMIDADAVLARPGVLAVLTHDNAPRLHRADDTDAELLVLQDDRVRYRGQAVALVIAETLEQARAGAELLDVTYQPEDHDVVFAADHPRLYAPEHVNPNYPTDTSVGDVDAALASAAIVVDATYSTPAEHNNPMEPHAAIAQWDGDRLTVYDSNQGATSVRQALTTLFGLADGAVRVLSEHVGGGFGAKGSTRPHAVLAAMGARFTERPIRVTLTRQQMFAMVGYRTPTIQHMRLGADANATLVALEHTAYSQTSQVLEFAEQTALISRLMYAAPNLRTRHRVVALDVPTPRWMRAPGEAPGSFALESAMDELATACGVDPIELRVRNEPSVEPDSGLPFSSRNLIACLHEGAERFGWSSRDPRPGVRRDGRWLIGTGVASSTYPARSAPSTAAATALADGSFVVEITASDIGTGARTALTQIAADELRAPTERVEVRIGDSDFGQAMIAGGSMGTASWSWAIAKACRELLHTLHEIGTVPPEGVTVHADTADDIKAQAQLSRHAFGAQFAEVRVDVDTGEVRVPRLCGVFAAGRIINAKTGRSQLIGGMTMGIGMALLEEGVMDPQFGDYVNHDLASYHVPVNGDVHDIDVSWIDEHDDRLNPVGVKGIGEIGIVGTAAALANAVWHATGHRHRHLPIRPDRVLTSLA
jgi:xanthine dehydrogenase YagR molybdenum-binding subunit